MKKKHKKQLKIKQENRKKLCNNSKFKQQNTHTPHKPYKTMNTKQNTMVNINVYKLIMLFIY